MERWRNLPSSGNVRDIRGESELEQLARSIRQIFSQRPGTLPGNENRGLEKYPERFLYLGMAKNPKLTREAAILAFRDNPGMQTKILDLINEFGGSGYYLKQDMAASRLF